MKKILMTILASSAIFALGLGVQAHSASLTVSSSIEGGSIVMTIHADTPKKITALEVDHDNSVVPEFSVYAEDGEGVYGGDKTLFEQAGTSVQYDSDSKTWTLRWGTSGGLGNLSEIMKDATFYFVLHGEDGPLLGSMYNPVLGTGCNSVTLKDGLLVQTILNSLDCIKISNVSVTPNTGNVIKSNENFVLSFSFDETIDGSVYELEVDHDLTSKGVPEFSVYAEPNDDAYGDASDKTQFETAGVSVQYDSTSKTWTLTIQNEGDVFNAITENKGVKFHFVLRNKDKNPLWGSMDPVTPENTFEFKLAENVISISGLNNKTIRTGDTTNFTGQLKIENFKTDGLGDVSIKASSNDGISVKSNSVDITNDLTTAGSKLSITGVDGNEVILDINLEVSASKVGTYTFTIEEDGNELVQFTLIVNRRQSSSGGSRPVTQNTNTGNTSTSETPSNNDQNNSGTASTPVERAQELQKFGEATIPGARGESVAELQKFLNENGFGPLIVDGISGPQTLAAVERYINSSNNSASGITPSTILKVNNRGAGVSTLQALLNAKGFNVGPADGIFGPRTLAQVRAFQSANGLVVDGIVGPATLRALGL